MQARGLEPNRKWLKKQSRIFSNFIMLWRQKLNLEPTQKDWSPPNISGPQLGCLDGYTLGIRASQNSTDLPKDSTPAWERCGPKWIEVWPQMDWGDLPPGCLWEERVNPLWREKTSSRACAMFHIQCQTFIKVLPGIARNRIERKTGNRNTDR